MNEKFIANELIVKYIQGLCTDEERSMVESAFNHLIKNDENVFSKEDIETSGQRMKAVIMEHLNSRDN